MQFTTYDHRTGAKQYSPAGALRRLLSSMNRHFLLKTRTALWCAECQSVVRCRDVFPSHEALLVCGHRRSIADNAAALRRELSRLEREVEWAAPKVEEEL